MLEKLLKEDRVILEMKAKTREEALKELLEPLHLEDKVEEIVYDALLKRESIGSTGIGHGIAIPHCRSIVLDQVYLVVGRSKQGVDFEAIDKKPVHLFFMLLAPPLDPGTVYLITLGKIAHVARKLSKRKDYMETESPKEFIEYIKSLLAEEE